MMVMIGHTGRGVGAPIQAFMQFHLLLHQFVRGSLLVHDHGGLLHGVQDHCDEEVEHDVGGYHQVYPEEPHSPVPAAVGLRAVPVHLEGVHVAPEHLRARDVVHLALDGELEESRHGAAQVGEPQRVVVPKELHGHNSPDEHEQDHEDEGIDHGLRGPHERPHEQAQLLEPRSTQHGGNPQHTDGGKVAAAVGCCELDHARPHHDEVEYVPGVVEEGPRGKDVRDEVE
mmetsp:Transcript_65749/g.208097  ORF Transcript_65749/g.208097 Transcript_65749/m.208097 type:complete len:228 (+) Transcript_65749:134-817(+)